MFFLLQAQFNHVGTTSEYIDHLFSNKTLIQSLGLCPETMVREIASTESHSDDEGLTETHSKRPKLSFEDCYLMHCVLRDRARCDAM